MSDDLKDRVDQFRCLKLPGQPMGMHMGTAYLVGDLWAEVRRLRTLQGLVDAAAESGVEQDDPRISYVTIQMDRDTWTQIQAHKRREEKG